MDIIKLRYAVIDDSSRIFNILVFKDIKIDDNIVAFSCNEIYKFRKDIYGNEIYNNATSRIIVFTSGEDFGSSIKLENLIKELVRNKIIVDSFVLNQQSVEQLNPICAVCHVTGGFAFNPKNVSEILAILENNAFNDINEREKISQPLILNDRKTIPSNLTANQITKSFIDQIIKTAKFDTIFPNKEILINAPLFSPQKYFETNKSDDLSKANSRLKRILTELKKASETTDSNSINYDSNIIIFPYKSNIDQWRVFIKGPDESLYSKKWFDLRLSFPVLYPYHPPNIRFVTVPYHVNVSSDGKICASILENQYVSSFHVIDIIKEIKKLLLFPDCSFALNLEKYETYILDKSEYEKLARESAEKLAKDDYKDYLDVFLEDQ